MMTLHVLFAVPMGTYFLWVMWKEKKLYGGWLTFGGKDEEHKATLYFRGGFFFAVLGFSGSLPYYGQFEDQGGDTFKGKGIYAGTTWLPWYEGRGYVEFLNYTFWLLFGLYFLARAYMDKTHVRVHVSA